MITLNDAKMHLRIDFSDEDTYIQLLIEAAYDFVRDTLQRPIKVEEMSAEEGTLWDVPKTIDLAILLLVSHWYENRSAVVVGLVASEVAFSVTDLISHYSLVSTGG